MACGNPMKWQEDPFEMILGNSRTIIPDLNQGCGAVSTLPAYGDSDCSTGRAVPDGIANNVLNGSPKLLSRALQCGGQGRSRKRLREP